MSTTTTATRYTLGGGDVVLRGADPRLAAWVDEALTPTFRAATSPPEARGTEVGVEISAVPSVPTGSVVAGTAPGFALDQRLAMLPVRRAGARTWLQDDHFRVAYELDGRTVRVGALGAGSRLGPAVLRVIRELVVAHALGQEDRIVDLHAAGISVGGTGVLLVGPKRSGKTTTLAALAVDGRAEIIANDRVLVVPDGNATWRAQGVPTLVNVRRGTLDRLPAPFRHLPQVEHLLDLTLAELEQMSAPGDGATSSTGLPPPTDLPLSPAQLAHVLGARRVAAAPLGAILALRVETGHPAFRLRELDAGAARSVLAHNGFGASTAPRPATVFEEMVGRRPTWPPPEGVLAALARDVRVLELTIGAAFLEERSVADAVLAALT